MEAEPAETTAAAGWFLAAADWLPVATIAAVALAAAIWWSWRPGRARAARLFGIGCKGTAVGLLLVTVLEPTSRRRTIEPQENLFLVLAVDSRSLQIPTGGQSGVDRINRILRPDAGWRQRLAAEFDVRLFRFGRRVGPLPTDDDPIDGEQTQSSLLTALSDLTARFEGRPVAGVLVLSDGIATDTSPEQDGKLPPVYPVAIGSDSPGRDLRVSRVSTSEANFESAPVTVRAEVGVNGQGQAAIVSLIDPRGNAVQTRRVDDFGQSSRAEVTFRLQPPDPGIAFYSVAVASADDIGPDALPDNDRRLLTIDRTGGPYRVLYLSGRPNWEFKFLRRALDADDQINLVGLIRMAGREPKFSFRSDSDRANPLFRGFGADAEETETYDEPVMIRLGTRDADELRGGFPATADELFAYHAVVLDDIEAEFFTQDQKELLAEFVSRRGGGLLMLGGRSSLAGGGYARTPIGDLLPVYLDREPPDRPAAQYRLSLTREGWLQPWMRLRPTEQAERDRLAKLPPFATLNRHRSIKPGARVLATVEDTGGGQYPAMVAQPVGRGQVGTMLIGDLWKWQMQRAKAADDDFFKAWRQTIRWLVSEVPAAVEVATLPQPDGSHEVRVIARDESFERLDNASVTVRVNPPKGEAVELLASPVSGESGEYVARYQPRAAGGYRVAADVDTLDGASVGTAHTGFVFDPLADEFREVVADRELLASLAERTGGEMLDEGDLDRFVRSLRDRDLPRSRVELVPLWHRWPVLLAVLGLLLAEWTLRRRGGLA